MSFKGTTKKIISYFLPYQKNNLQTFTENPEKIIEIFEKFSKGVNNYNIEQFNSFDKYLLALAQNENEKNIANLISNSISISTFISMAKISDFPIVNFVNTNFNHFILNNENIPDLGFILFKTGKNMNSKTKFENWIIFIDNSSKLKAENLKDLISKIYQAIRKFLTAGKAGENGMKLNEENCYNPPVDAMNDIFKLMENIINETGENDKIYLGIDCNANNFYSDENKTYEMDGFKKPPETEELINFYVKLCQDHPMLKYLEDPLGDGDLMGWKKMLDKFKEEKPEVKICSKSLVLDDIQKLSAIIDKNEDEENDENNNENNNNNNENNNNNI